MGKIQAEDLSSSYGVPFAQNIVRMRASSDHSIEDNRKRKLVGLVLESVAICRAIHLIIRQSILNAHSDLIYCCDTA